MAYATTYKPISWILLRNSGATFWTQSEEFRIRAHSVPKNPRSPDQRASRSSLGEAKRQWSTLSAADKLAWSAFARSSLVKNKREQPKKWRGIDAFVRASISRQTAGLSSMPSLPETDRRPNAPSAIDLLAGSDARELAFRIEHNIADPSSHALMVRMTPTGNSSACRPYKSSLRHVRGVSKDSVFALPASGQIVRIPETRFTLRPGCMYAVEVRIMRLADGAVSDPRYQAAKREEEVEIPGPSNADVAGSAGVPPANDTAGVETAAGTAALPAEIAAAMPALPAKTAVEMPALPAENAGGTPALPAEATHALAVHPTPGDPRQWRKLTQPILTDYGLVTSGMRTELVNITDQRGSINFPSAYVLSKHFSDPELKKRKTQTG